MAKHRLEKSKTDLLGQYMTVNADRILENFRDVVKDKFIIDPCAGRGDLLQWAEDNSAKVTQGYDIDVDMGYPVNDMYRSPIDCTGAVVVTNPPYLSKNRADDKAPFDKWKQSDLYKCYLATLVESNVEEAIIIQPSNFLCESREKARNLLFQDYSIQYAEHWQEEIFPEVAIGIMVMHIKKGGSDTQEFDYVNRTSGKITKMLLKKKKGYLFGPNALLNNNNYIRFEKVDKGMDAPNSNIVISLLDKGKFGLGFVYNREEPIYCNPKSFTTYQINTPEPLDAEEQMYMVCAANHMLDKWRIHHDSMFLGNYIDYNQKIMSRTIANKILSKLYEETMHSDKGGR